MNIYQGMKRVTWVISGIGLVFSVISFSIAAYNYFGPQTTIIKPFLVELDNFERLAINKRMYTADAEKARAYISELFVINNLKRTYVKSPSGNQDDSNFRASLYVRGYLEHDYPVFEPIGFGIAGLFWFSFIWIIFYIVFWIINGFKQK